MLDKAAGMSITLVLPQTCCRVNTLDSIQDMSMTMQVMPACFWLMCSLHAHLSIANNEMDLIPAGYS